MSEENEFVVQENSSEPTNAVNSITQDSELAKAYKALQEQYATMQEQLASLKTVIDSSIKSAYRDTILGAKSDTPDDFDTVCKNKFGK